MSINMEKRLQFIDCAKGIGILLVVIAHHLQDSPSVLQWIYSFHMPLFFIITGYLYARKSRIYSFEEAFGAGAKAYMYPFFTLSVVLIIWWIFFGVIFDTQYEEPIGNIIIRTATTYGYHAMWFLPTLFLASIISKTYRQKNRLYIMIISIMAGYVLSYCANSTSWCTGILRYIVMYFGRAALALSFIEIGRFVYIQTDKPFNRKNAWVYFVVAAITSIVLSQENIQVSMAFSRIGNPIVYYAAACAGSAAILLLSKIISDTGVARSLCCWGQDSLIVMALHMDISIEIAWIIVSIIGLSNFLSFRDASIVAILIELILLKLMCTIIKNYFPFLISLINRNKVNK